ncbi:MAG TPA: hypothetical protein VIQ30_12065 [Pseudonocardia sp.]|jgi:ABC-type transporter Mla subunit MlaD
MTVAPTTGTGGERRIGAGQGRSALRVTWAVALAFTIASLTGILVLTSDLARTDAVLRDALGEILRIASTTGRGMAANQALPPTNDTLVQSLPEVVSTVRSLGRARTTLGTLGTQLGSLATVLGSADPPLARIVDSARDATDAARETKMPAAHIARTLRTADNRARSLGPELDEALSRSRSIESRLRILGLLPAG